MTGLLALALAGAALVQVADVPVLARVVDKGEVLAVSDFTTAPLAVAQARDALSAPQAAGMEAARRLTAGSAVRRTDLIKPQLVRRGEAVRIVVRGGGLAIVTDGRALSGGAKGDLVRVVSLSTRRTLDAIVDGNGSVRLAAH